MSALPVTPLHAFQSAEAAPPDCHSAADELKCFRSDQSFISKVFDGNIIVPRYKSFAQQNRV